MLAQQLLIVFEQYAPAIPPIIVQRLHQYRLALEHCVAACATQRLGKVTGCCRSL